MEDAPLAKLFLSPTLFFTLVHIFGVSTNNRLKAYVLSTYLHLTT